MAFGDLIKNDTVTVALASTATPDLGSNPASGNLLIATFGSDRTNRTVSSAPSGFTLLHDTLGGGRWTWYYKISDGTEQTASLSWSGNVSGVGEYLEYEWDGTTPTVTKNDDQTNINGSVTTQASGAATPTTSTNILIAVHGTDKSQNSNNAQAVDGSWSEDALFYAVVGGHLKVSSLVNAATSSQEATHTSSGVGDEMYGAIAVFDSAGGGGGGTILPFIMRQIN